MGLKEGRGNEGGQVGGGGGGRAEGRLRMPTHKEEIPRNTYLIPSHCSRALFRFNLGCLGGGGGGQDTTGTVQCKSTNTLIFM